VRQAAPLPKPTVVLFRKVLNSFGIFLATDDSDEHDEQHVGERVQTPLSTSAVRNGAKKLVKTVKSIGLTHRRLQKSLGATQQKVWITDEIGRQPNPTAVKH
jgi:hypothetical protein